jgi:hypothetical protein
MKKDEPMKNCSTCARFDQNATKRDGTGACLSATSPNADRIMGTFGLCDSHEPIQAATAPTPYGEAA